MSESKFSKFFKEHVWSDSDEAKKNSDSNVAEKEPEATGVATEQATATETPIATTGGIVDEKIKDRLNKAIEESNIDGFDYFEYRETIKKMTGTEASRFQNAYAAAEQMGLTKPKLVETARHYVQVLKAEEENFENAVTEKEEELVTSKKEQIAAIDEQIKEAYAQIENLNKQITEKQNEKAELASEVAENSERLEVTRQNFKKTVQSLVDGIESDIEKIEKHLA